jgi:hypothetical protein
MATTSYVVKRQSATETTHIYFTSEQQNKLATWEGYEHCGISLAIVDRSALLFVGYELLQVTIFALSTLFILPQPILSQFLLRNSALEPLMNYTGYE